MENKSTQKHHNFTTPILADKKDGLTVQIRNTKKEHFFIGPFLFKETLQCKLIFTTLCSEY